MKNISELKVGVLLSYLTIFMTVIVGFLLTPYMLKRLGQAEYGLYAMMGSFVATLGLLDFGINNAIVRYVAKYKSEKNKESEKVFLGTIFNIYFGISFILLIIGTILYFNLDTLLNKSLTAIELKKAKIMFIILIFNLVVLLPGNAFNAISSGYEKFVFPRASILIKYLVRSLVIVSILYFGTNAVGIVIVDTVMNILLILANMYYVIRFLNIKIALNVFQKKMMYEVFSYSFWIFIIAITRNFQWQLSQFLVGLKTNTQTVAVMSIGLMLSGFYSAFGGGITSVLLPKATNLVVKEASTQELSKKMIEIGRIILFIQLYLYGGFIIFGHLFISLWVGDKYDKSWLIAVLIMSVMTFIFTQGFGNSIIEAQKKIKFRSITYLIIIVIGISLGYILIDRIGILGMVVGITLSLFANVIAMNIYYHKVIKLNMLYFWEQTYLKISIVFGIIIIFFNLVVKHFYQFNNWFDLLLLAVTYSTVYLFCMYFFVLNGNERKILYLDKFFKYSNYKSR